MGKGRGKGPLFPFLWTIMHGLCFLMSFKYNCGSKFNKLLFPIFPSTYVTKCARANQSIWSSWYIVLVAALVVRGESCQDLRFFFVKIELRFVTKRFWIKMAEKKIDNRSVLERLFDDGDFEHLIVEIFLFLDGPTLEACSVVSKRFREIIKSKFVKA